MSDPAAPGNQYTEFLQYDADDTEIRDTRLAAAEKAEQDGDKGTAQKLRRLIGD